MRSLTGHLAFVFIVKYQKSKKIKIYRSRCKKAKDPNLNHSYIQNKVKIQNVSLVSFEPIDTENVDTGIRAPSGKSHLLRLLEAPDSISAMPALKAVKPSSLFETINSMRSVFAHLYDCSLNTHPSTTHTNLLKETLDLFHLA